ncbi:hypothetical protein ACHAWF_002060 [Thalassiosira exigua]
MRNEYAAAAPVAGPAARRRRRLRTEGPAMAAVRLPSPSPSPLPQLPSLLFLLLLPASSALTITTFNILAPVHRSMTPANARESEREDWWRPRAEGVADYLSKAFASSDAILLQEWWFDEEFSAVFEAAMGDAFVRVAERRPGGDKGTMRDDGMCCLVRKEGGLELVRSGPVLTGPQRIAQIVQCRERGFNGEGRDVFIANAHLSFPGHRDPIVNGQRQADEASIILDALSEAGSEWTASNDPGRERLEVVCGDFNSNSCGLAASLVESPPRNFVNCASASAEQTLANVGGRVNLGVTHCDHLGQKVSVDHIFLRLVRGEEEGGRRKSSPGRGADELPSRPKRTERCAALSLGYLDAKGTRVLGVRRGDLALEGRAVLSDHRPVTAKVAWPRAPAGPGGTEERLSEVYSNATMPLDPLEPAWGIVDPPPWGVTKEQKG